MEKTYKYFPKNVCSKEMVIVLDGKTVKKITTVRGCAGNTQGVNRMCEGRDIDEVIQRLQGIRCPGSKTGLTSCPNELATALKEIEEGKLLPID